MKKLSCSIAVLAISFFWACCPVFAGSPIAINEANFPDAFFLTYVSTNFDINKDDQLSDTEIDVAKKITLPNGSVSSLKGIEYFIALEELKYYGFDKALTDLELSKNTALISLDCSYCELENIDLKNQTALKYLNISGNKITTLDISKCTALTHLICNENWGLTALDVSKCTSLEYLSIRAEQNPHNGSNPDLYHPISITDLDVSKNNALTYLDCYYGSLKKLTFGDNAALNYLNCAYNQIENLDLSKASSLVSVDCYNNALTNLQLGASIKSLKCYSNSLTNLDTSKSTAINFLDCDSNDLTTLDLSQNNTLEKLYCANNELINLDISKCTSLNLLDCRYNALTSLNIGSSSSLTTLYCYNNKLENLDISKCVALNFVDCHNNVLAQLNFGDNAALTDLYCDTNQLTNLEINKCATLSLLSCGKNNLMDLDTTNNASLKALYCNDNKLTKLDISKNPELVSLGCANNQLVSLDLSEHTAMKGIVCSGNSLTVLDLEKNNLLPWVTYKTEALSPLVGGGDHFDKYTDSYPAYGITTSLDFYSQAAVVEIISHDDSTYPYKLALETICLTPSQLVDRVLSMDVTDSADNVVTVSNDEIYFYFSTIPSKMTYYYDTKNEKAADNSEEVVYIGETIFTSPYMDVIVTFVEESNKSTEVPSIVGPDSNPENESGGGCNSSVSALALLILSHYVFRKINQ